MEEIIEKPAALALPERAALALQSPEHEVQLHALAAKAKNITAILNADAREECHSTLMTLVKTRTTIEGAGKAAREDATKFSKAVIAEEKRLLAITEAEEKRLKGLRDAWDAERAAEKAERERIERARVAAIGEQIAALKMHSVRAMQARTSAQVADIAADLQKVELAEWAYAEFLPEAIDAHKAATERVAELHAVKMAEEIEAARVKAEQAAAAAALKAQQEAARAALQAEREALAQQKAAQAKAEAEAAQTRKSEAEALAAQRAAFEAERAAFEAEKQAEKQAQGAAEAAAKAQAQAQAENAAQRAAELAQFEAERAELAKALALPVIEPAKIAAAFEADQIADDMPVSLIEPDQPVPMPTKAELLQAVAERFGVAADIAQLWLVTTFSH